MDDKPKLIQQELVEKVDNNDPEYQRLMAAYSDNPFFDLTKDSIKSDVEEKEKQDGELKGSQSDDVL